MPHKHRRSRRICQLIIVMSSFIEVIKSRLIDLSTRLIYYSAWTMYVCDSLKWNGSRPTFCIFTALDGIFSNYPKITNPEERRWTEIQSRMTFMTFSHEIFLLFLPILPREIFLDDVCCLDNNYNHLVLRYRTKCEDERCEVKCCKNSNWSAISVRRAYENLFRLLPSCWVQERLYYPPFPLHAGILLCN